MTLKAATTTEQPNMIHINALPIFTPSSFCGLFLLLLFGFCDSAGTRLRPAAFATNREVYTALTRVLYNLVRHVFALTPHHRRRSIRLHCPENQGRFRYIRPARNNGRLRRSIPNPEQGTFRRWSEPPRRTLAELP